MFTFFSFFLPPSFLKTTATKKGGEETVRARDSVLQDHFLPAWKPYCNLLDQTKRTSTAARSKIKKKRKKKHEERRKKKSFKKREKHVAGWRIYCVEADGDLETNY